MSLTILSLARGLARAARQWSFWHALGFMFVPCSLVVWSRCGGLGQASCKRDQVMSLYIIQKLFRLPCHFHSIQLPHKAVF